ncbi:MAG: hypothetical protein F6K31_08970 [Symploca sp. SIO2G7]|nr:hypothetical protein [Symploca sp. SIO2G7]
MTQRLKRWESPRRQGRNDKGKGGSARRRQLKKQTQMLRKKLKKSQKAKNQNHNRGREFSSLPLLFIAKLKSKFSNTRRLENEEEKTNTPWKYN